MRGWLAALGLTMVAAVGAAVALILVVAGSGSTSVVDLEVGDCFDLPVADGGDVLEFETVDVIACDEPHEAEVVFVGELDPDGDSDYPDDVELFALAERRCAGAGDVPIERFGVVPIAPTRDTWEGANGRFSCIALPFGGGSVEGGISEGSTGG